MIPVLYAPKTKNFDNNGLGGLVDAITCTVTEERNSTYELKLKYPISGQHYSEIAISSIIKAENYKGATPQLFRIYKISKPTNGQVTIEAEHISYQLSQIPVMPVDKTEASTPAEIFKILKSYAAEDCPYTFESDVTTTKEFELKVPASFRSCLGGMDGSVLDLFGGGEYEFDNYTVRFKNHRGTDNGVTLRYGKNITDITQEENIENTITGICPYWKGTDDDGNEDVATYDEKVVHSSKAENFPYQRTMVYDFSSYYEDKPTSDQLKQAAEDYISDNNIGVPDVDLTISYQDLSNTTEYKYLGQLEAIKLCDTIHVEFEKLDISVSAKVKKVTYDVLAEQYTSIEIGSSTSNLSKTISQIISDETNDLATTTQVDGEVAKATKRITGNNGGYVVMRDGDGDGYPDEIDVMDAPTIEKAVKVWRWNKNGLGYSSTGQGGPYGLAMTDQGAIVADYIATGKIKSRDANSKYEVDLDTGSITMKDATITNATIKDGNINITTSSETDDKIKISYGKYTTLLTPGFLETSNADYTSFLSNRALSINKISGTAQYPYISAGTLGLFVGNGAGSTMVECGTDGTVSCTKLSAGTVVTVNGVDCSISACDTSWGAILLTPNAWTNLVSCTVTASGYYVAIGWGRISGSYALTDFGVDLYTNERLILEDKIANGNAVTSDGTTVSCTWFGKLSSKTTVQLRLYNGNGSGAYAPALSRLILRRIG